MSDYQRLTLARDSVHHAWHQHSEFPATCAICASHVDGLCPQSPSGAHQLDSEEGSSGTAYVYCQSCGKIWDDVVHPMDDDIYKEGLGPLDG